DPNDKISDPPGLDSLGYVHPTTSSFDYTIRFQNTGNDTAIAVVLYDQLDSNLDWSSINILGSSHEVDVQIDQNGLAIFTFDSIFLPDSSTNEIESHGFIKYHIDLNSNVPVGTQIKNTAEIYFDYNPPIITNTVINTLYNCSNLSLIMSSLSVCENELISVSGDLSDMVIDWNIIGVDNGVGNELLWIADTVGIFDLQLYASHPFCNIDTLTTITVFPEVLPTILDSTTICFGDSTLIFGQFQSQSGTYIEVLQSSNGCDSLIMKALNVLSPIPLNIIDTLTICEGDSIELFGLFEYQSGVYQETVFAANGCDSSNAYFLEVQQLPQVNIGTLGSDSLCIYHSSILLNSGSPVGGVYSGSGVNMNVFDPSIAGVGLHNVTYTYTSPFGCMDLDSTNIFVSECLGLTDLNLANVRIYPNPLKEELKIDFGNFSTENVRIEMINVLGQNVYRNSEIESSPFILMRDKLISGTYIVNIYREDTLFFSDLIVVM
ncbi:MAG: T9SS type A sorting domain-containing protein, partial [Crocinitomicaceae bacterium]